MYNLTLLTRALSRMLVWNLTSMELTTLSTAHYLLFLEIIWLVNILEDSNPFLVLYETIWYYTIS